MVDQYFDHCKSNGGKCKRGFKTTLLKDTNEKVGLLEITYDDLKNEINRFNKKKNDCDLEIVSPTTEEGDSPPAVLESDQTPSDDSSATSVAAGTFVGAAVGFSFDDDASSSASTTASASDDMNAALAACQDRNKGGCPKGLTNAKKRETVWNNKKA